MVTRVLFCVPGQYLQVSVCRKILCNHLIRQRQLQGQIECDSAGTLQLPHLVARQDSRMAQAAKPYGITLKGRARQFIPRRLRTGSTGFWRWIGTTIETFSPWPRQPTHSHKVRPDVRFFAARIPIRKFPTPTTGRPKGSPMSSSLLMDACNGFLDHVLTHPTPPLTD